MPSSSQPVNLGKKILRLGIAVFTIAALYSAAWFYAAYRGNDWLHAEISNPGDGMAGSCTAMKIKGFPFRAGVSCTSASFSIPAENVHLETGAIKTMAMIYNPGKAVLELDGPLISHLANGMTLEANWTNFKGSLRVSLSGLSHFTMSADRIRSEIGLPDAFANLIIESSYAELHATKNGPDLDVAAAGDNMQVESALLLAAPLPRFSLSSNVTLNGMSSLLSGEPPVVGQEISGTLHDLTVDFGNQGKVSLSGPFQFSKDGYLSGDFDVEAENFTTLQPILDASFPDSAPTIDASVILLKSLPKTDGKANIKLTVRSGAILLGVIPVGFIPPL